MKGSLRQDSSLSNTLRLGRSPWLRLCLYTSMARDTQFTFSGRSGVSLVPDSTCKS